MYSLLGLCATKHRPQKDSSICPSPPFILYHTAIDLEWFWSWSEQHLSPMTGSYTLPITEPHVHDVACMYYAIKFRILQTFQSCFSKYGETWVLLGYYPCHILQWTWEQYKSVRNFTTSACELKSEEVCHCQILASSSK